LAIQPNLEQLQKSTVSLTLSVTEWNRCTDYANWFKTYNLECRSAKEAIVPYLATTNKSATFSCKVSCCHF